MNLNLPSSSARKVENDLNVEMIGPGSDASRILTAERIARRYDLHAINADLLASRGFQPGARLKRYLEPSIDKELGDPLKLKNVEKSFALTIEALQKGTDIAVFCDYDVDGVTAAWQEHTLLSTLRDAVGSKSKIEVIASRRMSGGYGVAPEVARKACENGAGLLITLDMGTQQGALLRELEAKYGVKTIVKDHHTPGKDDIAPPLMINPRQRGEKIKYKDLSAGGLIYVQKRAYEKLLKDMRKPWATKAVRALKALEPDFVSFATLSSVADVMPLTGFNRALVRAGLVFMTQMAATPDNKLLSAQWQRRAMVGLLQACGLRHKDLVSQDIGFKLGPVLNALGRLIDEGAQRAVDFFLTPDLRVVELALAFVENNQVRKETEARAVKQALEACETEFKGAEAPQAVVVVLPEMHPGVQGIVAARVRDKYFRSAGLGTISPDRKTISFSWRGIRLKDGTDISIKQAFEHPVLKTILDRPGNKGGGHAAAGGCTIKAEELEEFKAAAQTAFGAQMEGRDVGRFMQYDRESTLAEILAGGVAMVKEQKRIFGPCGKGNFETVHLVRGLTVMTITEAGTSGTGRHWIVKLKEDSAVEGERPRYVDGMLWFTSQSALPKPGTRVDVLAELSVDEHKAPHNEALQKVLLDIKHLTGPSSAA